MSHKWVLGYLAVAGMLAVLAFPLVGGVQVLEDPRGDTDLVTYGGHDVPDRADPAREASPQNGSAADVRSIHVAENATHISISLQLENLPPKPEGCGSPAAMDAVDCTYRYSVRWSYYDESLQWGPQGEVRWDVTCRSGLCLDSASFLMGRTLGDDHPGLTFERVPPDTGRWTIRKDVFVLPEHDDNEEPGLCPGDVLFNFRFGSWGNPRVPHTWFVDRRNGNDTGLYEIRTGGEDCPAPGSRGDQESPTDGRLRPVVLDESSDVYWNVGGVITGPAPAKPVRDAVAERNESETDLLEIRVGAKGSDIFVEADYADLPPHPSECTEGGVLGRCSYAYETRIRWSYLDQARSWGPEVALRWTGECDDACREVTTLQVGDGPRWTDAGDHLDLERISPNTVRWVVDQSILTTHGPSGAASSATCLDDVFADFRFSTRGEAEFGVNRYRDSRDGIGGSIFRVASNQPGCTTSGMDGSANPTQHGGTISPYPQLAALVVAVLAAGGLGARFT